MKNVLRELALAVHCAAALLTLYLLFAMIPGDGVDVNTVGAVAMIVMAAAADLVITVPITWYTRRRV
jgi:hypothetical protein